MSKRSRDKETEPGAERVRLDALLVERELCTGRDRARALIMAGDVIVDDAAAMRPDARVRRDAAVRLRAAPRFVSRGGDKLDGALDAFALDVSGLRALDAGASTGGFTDCLLQRGAASVAAVDVGYGQLDVKLRNDPRVTVRERANARLIQPGDFPEPFDLAVIDVSFISLEKVLAAVRGVLKSNGMAVALVKPQFEAGPKRVPRGGVVRDPEVHADVLRNAVRAAAETGFTPEALTHSPIKGPKGNIEFFLLLKCGTSASSISGDDIARAVDRAHEVLDADSHGCEI